MEAGGVPDSCLLCGVMEFGVDCMNVVFISPLLLKNKGVGACVDGGCCCCG